jgi:uncharacterized membrane protein
MVDVWDSAGFFCDEALSSLVEDVANYLRVSPDSLALAAGVDGGTPTVSAVGDAVTPSVLCDADAAVELPCDDAAAHGDASAASAQCLRSDNGALSEELRDMQARLAVAQVASRTALARVRLRRV